MRDFAQIYLLCILGAVKWEMRVLGVVLVKALEAE